MLTCRECIEGLEKTAEYFRYWQEVGNFGDRPVFREHEKHCNDAIAMLKEHLNCSKKSNSSDRPEIVRCRDCTNWDKSTIEHYEDVFSGSGDTAECKMFCDMDSWGEFPDDIRRTDGDWFCADGERENVRKPVSISATDYDGINCE